VGIALLDTSIVVAALNRHDALHQAASHAVRTERDRHGLAISALTYAEVLVGPLRAGPAAVEIVERFAAQTRVLDVSPGIARLAAELRATRGLGLPDAVIVATGLRHQADVILTGDARWKGIETVRVVGESPG
jgi:predicted nucleic acid-binding protein